MKSVLNTFLNVIKAKLSKFSTYIKLYTDPKFIKNKVLLKIKDFFLNLLNVKPKNKDDYYTVFRWMISKKLVFLITIFLGVVSITFIIAMKPMNIMGNFQSDEASILTYRYDSLPLRYHTGQVKILGKADYLAYMGEVKDGVVKGKGKLFNKEKCLVYEGEFDNNMYNGIGKRFYENQSIWYEGEFVDNEFSGNGILYRENGTKEYEGNFQNGEMNGSGKLFDESGNQLIEGNFLDNNLNYNEFLGKTTQELSQIYTGKIIVYTDNVEFGIAMPAIDVVYDTTASENAVDETYTVQQVFIVKDKIKINNKELSNIDEIKAYFGEPIYEGNTNLIFMECVTVNLLIDLGNTELEAIEMKSDLPFSDVVNVTYYDKAKEIYIYTFKDNGLLYTFYSTNRNGDFSFYSMKGD